MSKTKEELNLEGKIASILSIVYNISNDKWGKCEYQYLKDEQVKGYETKLKGLSVAIYLSKDQEYCLYVDGTFITNDTEALASIYNTIEKRREYSEETARRARIEQIAKLLQ